MKFALPLGSVFLWFFAVSAIELMSVVHIVTGLGFSVVYALIYVIFQLIVELGANQLVPGLVRRIGLIGVLWLSVPLRLSAFALLELADHQISILLVSAAFAAFGSGLSDATRSALIARAVGNANLGKRLAFFEVATFCGASSGALISAIFYQSLGFAALVGFVGLMLCVSVVLLSLFDRSEQAVACSTDAGKEAARTGHVPIPVWLRMAWWMTGWRYVLEGVLYPLYALATYGSVVKVGILAAVGPVSGYVAGFLFDKGFSPKLGFAFSLIVFACVGLLRVGDPVFSVAVLLACLSAVVGKALGMFEKAASYSLSGNGKNIAVVVSRERNSVSARIPLIIGCVWVSESIGSALLLAYFLTALVGLVVLTRRKA